MAESEVDVIVGYLYEFAGTDGVGVDDNAMSSIAAHATTSSSAVLVNTQTGAVELPGQATSDGTKINQTGPSATTAAGLMVEGRDLLKADAVSRNQLTTYVTSVQQGMLGYRSTAKTIGARYDAADAQIAGLVNKLAVQRPGLPDEDPRFSQAVMNEE
ncbi:hypothetical protein [Kribbella sp. NPDC051620]|uniref:hypothetical protein n=1 Tax=Kribbella sp. NPDC051620 TaxID=3364120 RepID=UPI00378EFB1A